MTKTARLLLDKILQDEAEEREARRKLWVGLTDTQRDYFVYTDEKDKRRMRKYARYIEAILKANNT